MRAADYVEMTTTSIAGTSGDGAVTCTAITNVPTFTIVFGSGAVQVRYVIEDTVNKKFEQGIGSVASNVLTRTKPQVTWDGTTWSDQGPTALQFGSTPTTGNVKIRLAPLVEDSIRAMAGANTTISGEADWLVFRPSAAGTMAGPSSRTLTADREYYKAFLLDRPGRLLGIQFQVATAQASSNLKMALLACGVDGLPGQKILDFTTTATTSTGVKTDTATGSWSTGAAIWLNPGWYFIGYIASHAIAINGTSGTVTEVSTPLGRGNAYGMTDTCYKAGSYATGLPALPAPTTLAPINGADARHIFGLKVTQ